MCCWREDVSTLNDRAIAHNVSIMSVLGTLKSHCRLTFIKPCCALVTLLFHTDCLYFCTHVLTCKWVSLLMALSCVIICFYANQVDMKCISWTNFLVKQTSLSHQTQKTHTLITIAFVDGDKEWQQQRVHHVHCGTSSTFHKKTSELLSEMKMPGEENFQKHKIWEQSKWIITSHFSFKTYSLLLYVSGWRTALFLQAYPIQYPLSSPISGCHSFLLSFLTERFLIDCSKTAGQSSSLN